MFRFHTGSIKSFALLGGQGFCTTFRFHTGSIKRILQDYDLSILECFDSILVRLKGQSENQFSCLISRFRFHTGSIKSLSELQRVLIINAVSIPYWFD